MNIQKGSHSFKDFKFASGESLPELTIRYATLGQPPQPGHGGPSNVVLLLHNTSGSIDLFLRPGHAEPLFGIGGPLDPDKYFVIMPDAIGYGDSSKPSHGLKAHFPRYTYGDMVEAQYRLVTEKFGVKELRLVLEVSMGGMHAWMFVSTDFGAHLALKERTHRRSGAREQQVCLLTTHSC